MLDYYAPLWLAGLLGAGIMAAVMASDSQILALSTMFTEDVFAYYGGKSRFGPAVQVQTGRLFVVLIALVAYAIALQAPPGIFGIAVQYAFSGFTTLLPLLVAALFWRGSTKWGALAVVLWTAATMTAVAVLQAVVPAPPPGTLVPIWTVGGLDVDHAHAGRHRGARLHARPADADRLVAADVRRVAADPGAGGGDAAPLLPGRLGLTAAAGGGLGRRSRPARSATAADPGGSRARPRTVFHPRRRGFRYQSYARDATALVPGAGIAVDGRVAGKASPHVPPLEVPSRPSG